MGCHQADAAEQAAWRSSGERPTCPQWHFLGLAIRSTLDDQANIYGALHARVPMPTPDEQRAVQEENAEADESFWDMLRDMNASQAEGHKGIVALAEAKIAEFSRGAADAGEKVRHFGFRHAHRALSLTVACCGHGAEKGREEEFRKEVEAGVAALRKEGMAAFAQKFADGPTFVQLKNKDSRGFAQFKRELAEHSAIGSANTRVGVQGQRPSLYDLVDRMKMMTTPTLVRTGDEDWPCLQPALLMKQNIPTAALSVMPNCGHAINIEDPDQFNRLLGDFIAQVDAGRWPKRDP
jgi:hypothetical protein